MTWEVRAIAQRLLTDARYRKNLLKRLRAGMLGPLELVLWAYAYGKPKEHVELSGPGGDAVKPKVLFYIPNNGRDGHT
ncbi:MAG: hypothetical protein H0W13_11865 [Nitrospirales bacterium]|nr:hypothetical protein [Nitrospirales bacterium]